MMKKYKKVYVALTVVICVATISTNILAATTPTLVTKLNTALKRILEYIEKLATPAAGIAIATGVMIRKLSFGDEEKMIIGKRTIINAIVGYLIIQLIDLIIKFIEGIV